MKIIKGGPLGDFEKFPKNSVTVPKNVKEGILWDFLTSIVLQHITQRRSGASQHMTKTSIILKMPKNRIYSIACVYIQQFNFVQ